MFLDITGQSVLPLDGMQFQQRRTVNLIKFFENAIQALRSTAATQK